MRKFISLLILLLSTMTTTMAKAPKTVTLRFIETSDVHGAFFPYDFIERHPLKGSMARVSSYVKKQRQRFGKNLILLDNGDILQGQPTCYYTNYVNNQEPNIAAEVVNYMDYDAETFGNHDVETGHVVYDKWISELNCPMLGANIINLKNGKPYVDPYVILERDGIRIAVLGMLTPAIPNWLHNDLWSGMFFEEMVSCAKKWIKVLKEQERADVVVGLFHSGWQGGIITIDYDEDATKDIAEVVPGFDAIFFGHDHVERNQTVNDCVCLDPSSGAQKVAQLTIDLTQVDGRWTVHRKYGQVVDVTHEPIDEDFMAHFNRQIDAVKQYVSQQIGVFETAMHSRDAYFGPSAIIDYIHQMQLKHTGADISLNAPLSFDSHIQAGPVYMSDMFKLYRYENQIYTLRMTGREVRLLLELSYDQWVNTMTSPDDHILLLEERTWNDNQRMGFKNLTFNFDSAAGIDYEVDVTKPDGQKVHILQFSDGRPFEETVYYRVAMNSYRGNGGCELLTRGALIPMDSIVRRIVYMSEHDQRYYLTEKIRREGHVNAKPLNNWRFVPEAWARPALERDRKLLFKD